MLPPIDEKTSKLEGTYAKSQDTAWDSAGDDLLFRRCLSVGHGCTGCDAEGCRRVPWQGTATGELHSLLFGSSQASGQSHGAGTTRGSCPGSRRGRQVDCYVRC